MNVELIGGGFTNKGGQLMTIAARDMVRSWDPAHRLYMPMNAGSPRDRAQAGCGTVLHLDSNRMPPVARVLRTSSRVVPGSRRAVAEDDIDVVLDISGFAYSDSWGPRTALRRAKSYPQWRDRGAKIVLMPQAFGPFSTDEIRGAVRSIVESSVLAFARDPVSLEYLDRVGGILDTVRSAPDFTNLLAVDDAVRDVHPPAPAAIVPNVRMLDKTDERQAAHYLRFLDTCVSHLAETTGVYLLVHETGDYVLAERVADRASSSVEIVTDPDPLILKSYLGQSAFVVGSRYHALVSALSQGVPVLAAGWSHKYETLLSEYHLTDNLVEVDASEEEIKRRLDSVGATANSADALRRLRNAAQIEKGRSIAMWEEVRLVTGL